MERIAAGRTVYFTTYVGTWFNQYPEIQFRKDLRLSKTAFRRLIEITSPAIMCGRDIYLGIPVSDKLMMVLWTLANREAYRVLGRRFGLNRGNIHYIVMKTCRAIKSIADKFIRWPLREEYAEWTRGHQLVDTIGALDASEFEVRQPLKQLPAYTSRKCKTTVKLQVVATLDLTFIDVSVGWPGSMHDSRIFKNSSLSKALRLQLENTPYHILADTAYPIGERVLIPFKNNRALQDHEKQFNRVHKRDRQHVERSFGLMKMKWRRLKFLDIFKMQNAHTIIMIAACLHNFGLIHDNWIEDAPQVVINHRNEDEDNKKNDDEDDAALGLEKPRMLAEEMMF